MAAVSEPTPCRAIRPGACPGDQGNDECVEGDDLAVEELGAPPEVA
jgi:hypothetical protein